MALIESEEQADEAYFSQLEVDLERYYADVDAELLADKKQHNQESDEELHLKERIYSADGRQTILTARLRYCNKRDAYKVIVPFNNSFVEFKEWFLYSRIWAENKDFISFDGEYLNWKGEAVMATLFLFSDALIYVTFNDYFNGWLESKIREAKDLIDQFADEALQRIVHC